MRHKYQRQEHYLSPQTNYNPLFMSVIERQGWYKIREDSLEDVKQECRSKENMEFERWLDLQRLKLVDQKNGWFKITVK
jgi:hypothetical protein